MLNVIERKIKLVVMRLGLATELGAWSVRIRIMPIACSAKKSSTRSLSKSAEVIGVLFLYSLAAAHLEYVSTKVCW
jgi:hypothetical protein